jgi:bisphosphoglycerate-independent phosphoglycerate mutase (AlkP superfamily)
VAAAGHEFRTFDHLRAGDALYHDITSHQPRLVGCDVPRRTPREAAGILLDIGRRHDLTMFEYFRTDEAGHAQSFEAAEEALSELDEMLRAIVDSLRDGEGLLVLSDHGNMEDLSSRQHTLNAVPVLGFGIAAAVAPRIRSLLDAHPALLELAG